MLDCVENLFALKREWSSHQRQVTLHCKVYRWKKFIDEDSSIEQMTTPNHCSRSNRPAAISGDEMTNSISLVHLFGVLSTSHSSALVNFDFTFLFQILIDRPLQLQQVQPLQLDLSDLLDQIVLALVRIAQIVLQLLQQGTQLFQLLT